MGDILEKFAANTYCIYQKTKGVLVVSPRDFTLLYQCHQFADGTIKIAVHSIDYPPCGEKKGAVRGHVFIAGWVFEPMPGDANSTKVTYISEVDLKGNIPSGLVKKAN